MDALSLVLAIICQCKQIHRNVKLCNLGMQSGDETARPAKLQIKLFPHAQMQDTTIQVFWKILPLLYLGTENCLSTLQLLLLFPLRSHTQVTVNNLTLLLPWQHLDVMHTQKHD